LSSSGDLGLSAGALSFLSTGCATAGLSAAFSAGFSAGLSLARSGAFSVAAWRALLPVARCGSASRLTSISRLTSLAMARVSGR
jgi:hypothetical protein